MLETFAVVLNAFYTVSSIEFFLRPYVTTNFCVWCIYVSVSMCVHRIQALITTGQKVRRDEYSARRGDNDEEARFDVARVTKKKKVRKIVLTFCKFFFLYIRRNSLFIRAKKRDNYDRRSNRSLVCVCV